MGWSRCNAGPVPVASSLFLGGLLTSRVVAKSSLAVRPRDFPMECVAEFDRGLMQWQPGGSGPEFELVTVAVASMAVVATDRHIHGEGLTALG